MTPDQEKALGELLQTLAFPSVFIDNKKNETIYAAPGLSKREHYAGLLMQGLYSQKQWPSIADAQLMAEKAVRGADELLAVLKANP